MSAVDFTEEQSNRNPYYVAAKKEENDGNAPVKKEEISLNDGMKESDHFDFDNNDLSADNADEFVADNHGKL